MRRLFFGALLLGLAACGGTRTSAQSGGSATPAQNPDQVVGEIAGRKITLKELDEKWRVTDPGEQARVIQLLYQSRRNVLDQMMGDALIEDAAKAAKLPKDQYLEQEVKTRAKPVTDADIRQFFESNVDRTRGQTLEQLREPITTYLNDQRRQQARAELVDQLKKKRAGDVHVLLDPPRQAIELALHDPYMGPATAPVTIVEFSDYQ